MTAALGGRERKPRYSQERTALEPPRAGSRPLSLLLLFFFLYTSRNSFRDDGGAISILFPAGIDSEFCAVCMMGTCVCECGNIVFDVRVSKSEVVQGRE